MRVIQHTLLGDPDEQHGVEPDGRFRTGRNALAALGAGADPGDHLCRGSVDARQSPQSVGRKSRIGATKTNVIHYLAGVETGAARRAQSRQFRPRFGEVGFGLATLVAGSCVMT